MENITMTLKQGETVEIVNMFPEIQDRISKIMEENPSMNWMNNQIDLYGMAVRQLKAEGWEMPLPETLKNLHRNALKMMEYSKK